MKPRYSCVAALIAMVTVTAGCQTLPKPESYKREQKWEAAMAKFAAEDQAHPPVPGGILFVGSSSIVKWKTLAGDFPHSRVINRGFGGSQIADSIAYFDTAVAARKPSKIFLYAGDNDVGAKKPTEEVVRDFKVFASMVRKQFPDARLYFLAIKPSIRRWALIDQIRAANAGVRAVCEKEGHLKFIDVATPMIGDDGKPRPELFVQDNLHMSAAGYRLWTGIVRPYVEE